MYFYSRNLTTIVMKKKFFFFGILTAGISIWAYRSSKQLKLIYNEESGQLIIDMMRRFGCCNNIIIENLIVFLNGEAYKGFDYSEEEKFFDTAIFIDVPDLEEGDLIVVKMKTRCSRQFKKSGSLEIV